MRDVRAVKVGEGEMMQFSVSEFSNQSFRMSLNIKTKQLCAVIGAGPDRDAMIPVPTLP